MFVISFKTEARRGLKHVLRFDAVRIVDAIVRHLSDEPERTSRSIKRLRGHQDATFRLRVGDYRVFYDVVENRVEIILILHKSDTSRFYREERP